MLIDKADKIIISKKEINGRIIRRLQVKGLSLAFFMPGSAVAINYNNDAKIIFNPKEVLEIRGLNESLIARNYCCCEECMSNSGRITDQKPLVFFFRKLNRTFRCKKCEREWTLEI